MTLRPNSIYNPLASVFHIANYRHINFIFKDHDQKKKKSRYSYKHAKDLVIIWFTNLRLIPCLFVGHPLRMTREVCLSRSLIPLLVLGGRKFQHSDILALLKGKLNR